MVLRGLSVSPRGSQPREAGVNGAPFLDASNSESERPAVPADGESSALAPNVCPAEHVGRRSRFWRDSPERRVKLAVAGVLVGSLILRLAFLAGRHSAPFSDMTGYDQRALLLLHQHTFQTGDTYGATYRGPGYIMFLAAIYVLAGHHWWAAYVVQSLLGVATLLGVYLLAGQLFSGKVALVSLLLAAGYLPFLAYAHLLLPETLFITFLVFSTYAFVRGVFKSSSLWLCLSGVLCALAALTRSEALLLPVAFLLWIALSRGRRSILRRLRSGLILFVLSMALVLTPWTVHNYLDQKQFIPADTVVGLNLLIGNHPGADGTFDEAPVWSNPAVEAALSQGKREAALDAIFRDQALSWISSHPGSFLALSGWRTLLFLDKTKDWLLDGIGSNTLDALSGFQQVYTWVLLFFALVGGFAGLRRGRQTLLPLLCFFYFLGGVSIFFFQTRYRLPAMPFVLMLAAYGLGVVGGQLERVVPMSWRVWR
ncbi:MAG TPA: glycosyltransferase family 39 protein [Candidatus Anoxymicrobiaceae bacterium]